MRGRWWQWSGVMLLWHDVAVVLRRLGFVVAQLAPKPGARRALARVVSEYDLPGSGWRVIDERTWRTGVCGRATDWGRRARAIGSVTAWRSFDLEAQRWCWVQVVPLASEPDALAAVEGVGDRTLGNLRSEVTVISEQDVEISLFPGAGSVWAREQHTSGPTGAGVAKTLAAATGLHLIVVCASGSPEWEWDAVTGLARRQAALLAPQ